MSALKCTAGALSLALLMAGASFQPSIAATSCPAFKVTAEPGEEGSGTVTFKISPAPDGLAFSWSVSAGTISYGQGTSEMQVTAPSGGPVTAMVNVIGLDPSCPSEASAKATVP